jgi:hypothetical protein
MAEIHRKHYGVPITPDRVERPRKIEITVELGRDMSPTRISCSGCAKDINFS